MNIYSFQIVKMHYYILIQCDICKYKKYVI